MKNLVDVENQALEAFNEGDYKRAKNIYYKLIEISPKNPRYFEYLGECHQRLGELRLAKNCNDRAKALNESNDVSHANNDKHEVSPIITPMDQQINAANNSPSYAELKNDQLIEDTIKYKEPKIELAYNELLKINGYQKIVSVEGSDIKIVYSGVFGSKSEKLLPIKNITSVEVKEPGTMLSGFIYFSVEGRDTGGTSHMPRGAAVSLVNSLMGGMVEKTNDENCITFKGREYYGIALEIQSYVLNYSKQNGNTLEQNSAPLASQLSVADEIRKLKQLEDEGILTEEEFTNKKQQLLGSNANLIPIYKQSVPQQPIEIIATLRTQGISQQPNTLTATPNKQSQNSSPSIPSKKKTPKGRWIFVVVLIVVLAGCGYWFNNNQTANSILEAPLLISPGIAITNGNNSVGNVPIIGNTAPTLKFSAVKNAALYRVFVYKLDANGHAGIEDNIWSQDTTTTSVEVPSGILMSGNRYVWCVKSVAKDGTYSDFSNPEFLMFSCGGTATTIPAATTPTPSLITKPASQLVLTISDLGSGWIVSGAAATSRSNATSAYQSSFGNIQNIYSPSLLTSEVAVYSSIDAAHQAYMTELSLKASASNSHYGDESFYYSYTGLLQDLVFRKANVVVWVSLKNDAFGSPNSGASIVLGKIQ